MKIDFLDINDESQLTEFAIKGVRFGAESGDAEGQTLLGLYYLTGEGGHEKDYKKARYWLEKAAAQNDGEACFHLYRMHNKGLGVPQDGVSTMPLLVKSAELGFMVAQFMLGVLYHYGGNELPQDDALAVQWLRKAAKQGSADALSMLGNKYMLGVNGKTDPKLAVRYYKKAAGLGFVKAMLNLGYVYANGKGVPRNYRESQKWLEKAAAKGNADAMYYLARQYAQGLGGQDKLERAAVLLGKAAKLGNDKAQMQVGALFASGKFRLTGKFAHISLVDKGREFLEKSAAQGNEEAIELLENLDGLDDGAGAAASVVIDTDAGTVTDIGVEAGHGGRAGDEKGGAGDAR